MSDTLDCPFCAAPTKPIPKDFDNQYQFDCPNCGMFLMYDAVYRKMAARGDYADHKPALLEFIKKTPESQIAYIGFKIPTVEGENGLYAEYRSLRRS